LTFYLPFLLRNIFVVKLKGIAYSWVCQVWSTRFCARIFYSMSGFCYIWSDNIKSTPRFLFFFFLRISQIFRVQVLIRIFLCLFRKMNKWKDNYPIHCYENCYCLYPMFWYCSNLFQTWRDNELEQDQHREQIHPSITLHL